MLSCVISVFGIRLNAEKNKLTLHRFLGTQFVAFGLNFTYIAKLSKLIFLVKVIHSTFVTKSSLKALRICSGLCNCLNSRTYTWDNCNAVCGKKMRSFAACLCFGWAEYKANDSCISSIREPIKRVRMEFHRDIFYFLCT